MHEMGLLAAALGEIVAANRERPITRVDLALGPGIDEAAARQAFGLAAAGTLAEHADVVMTRAADTLACLSCGNAYPGDRLTRCPSCAETGLVIRVAPEVEVTGWSACPRDAARHATW